MTLDGKKSGKAPEKSNFVNTCNLLSQYLKEKGKLKDVSREINGQWANIAGKSETSHHVTRATTEKFANNIEDLNFLPTQETMSPTDVHLPFASTCASIKETEGKAAQMTIFYDGKIWVFNGLPADKARQVALFACKGSSHSAHVASAASNWGKLKEHVLPKQGVTDSVIPIARRSSLHRFLGKRKERGVQKGPYQGQDTPAPASSSKNDEELELKL